MLRKNFIALVMILGLLFSYSALPTFASEVPDNRHLSINAEYNAMKSAYKEIFPEQYHYIEEFEANGIRNISSSQLYIVFDETRTRGNFEYQLTVYNNRQIITITTETLSTNQARIEDQYSVTKTFKVGIGQWFQNITVTYGINLLGYDAIESYEIGTGDFYINTACKHFKAKEDDSGNAYIAYENNSINLDGSGILYDIGVAVGHDRAKGICQPAKGWDSFLWYLINAFV